MASRAAPVQMLLAGVRDTSGQALASGKVYTYSAGTTTPEAIYTDKDKSVPASNPIILDSNGQAQVYADGYIKLIVKTSGDTTLYTWDYLYFGDDYTSATLIDTDGSGNTLVKAASGKSTKLQQNGADKWEIEATNADLIPSATATRDIGSSSYRVRSVYSGSIDLSAAATTRTTVPRLGQLQDSTHLWGGTSGGSANAQTITLSPAITAYLAGQRFSFIAGYTNTSGVTLNVNSVGATTVFSAVTGAPLLGGELQVNLTYEVLYQGGYFWLLNPSATWQTYSPTIVGITGATTYARFALSGKICNVHLDIAGTGSTTGFSVTLPYVSALAAGNYSFLGTGLDNGSLLTAPILAFLLANSNIATLYSTVAGGGWTASGSRSIRVSLTYEVA